jgi:hypothetical protein
MSEVGRMVRQASLEKEDDDVATETFSGSQQDESCPAKASDQP